MGLRLILTRHAKSSWDDPLLDDIERTLNTRGQRDADRVGLWLSAKGYHPDQAMISVARRTQETWSRIQETASTGDMECLFHQGLYLASSDRILQQLRSATAKTVILIAHNPGIGDFAARFASRLPPHPDFARYPTCATTVFDVAADSWSHIRFGQNTVLDFCIPRDLSD
ncbi:MULTISPECIES: SixA phosphatase family protein [Pacificibacter]|uniref:SixA phosphatase family protein n=1 Tax=Pacificibacter TaxID=1042323 RepID=UPI001C08BFB4|nr:MULTISPECIES: histidine phosphatase family protein [Pacificibacter]MBU2935118.1 histidine phosphatase family protein [Pacificibacter marinus]MDO6615908.1 histidine phosphatase family protein [Pacificibacter sp. 1_MG-2023]